MDIKGTTIVAVQKDGKCALAGDGQVTLGEATIMKHTARKVRRIYNDSVVVGFAGGVADAFTLCERFEAKLTMYGGSLRRAAVALAQDWRSDKVMRKLEALLICANASDLLIVSGTGEVIEPDDGIAAIGSGGMYALAAARAKCYTGTMKYGGIAAWNQGWETRWAKNCICAWTIWKRCAWWRTRYPAMCACAFWP